MIVIALAIFIKSDFSYIWMIVIVIALTIFIKSDFSYIRMIVIVIALAIFIKSDLPVYCLCQGSPLAGHHRVAVIDFQICRFPFVWSLIDAVPITFYLCHEKVPSASAMTKDRNVLLEKETVTASWPRTAVWLCIFTNPSSSIDP